MNIDMQKHIHRIRTIFVVLGTIYLLCAVGIGIIGLMATYNQMQTTDVAMIPTLLTGAIILIPIILFGALHICTGLAFMAGKGWARISLWILAILNLGSVPIGTGISIYAIWVLRKTQEQ